MSRRVDIILGSDIYESIVLDGKLEEENGLHLRNTIFGWVVSGKLPRETTSAVNSVTILKTDIDLRFWEIEEVHSPKQLTAEEMQCEQHFLETTQEAEDGRFKVKLPFKPEVSKLGESFTQARRRFMSLERRLIADPELHERYRIFIREFMDLGHLEEVPLNEIDKDPSTVLFATSLRFQGGINDNQIKSCFRWLRKRAPGSPWMNLWWWVQNFSQTCTRHFCVSDYTRWLYPVTLPRCIVKLH